MTVPIGAKSTRREKKRVSPSRIPGIHQTGASDLETNSKDWLDRRQLSGIKENQAGSWIKNSPSVTLELSFSLFRQAALPNLSRRPEETAQRSLLSTMRGTSTRPGELKRKSKETKNTNKRRGATREGERREERRGRLEKKLFLWVLA